VTRFEQKLKAFRIFTESLGDLSTCQKRNVGAIIIPTDFSRVMSIGFNGPPADIPAEECDCIEGGKTCVHAEANALIKLAPHFKRRSLVMLISTSPCESCAGLIINSQEIGLVLFSMYSSSLTCLKGERLLQLANIPASCVFYHDVPTLWKNLENA
jgi:deoxycytidylate deaminase